MPFGETVFISMRDSLDVECLCRIEKEKNALQAEGDDLSVSLETLQKQKVFCTYTISLQANFLFSVFLFILSHLFNVVLIFVRPSPTSRIEPLRSSLMTTNTRLVISALFMFQSVMSEALVRMVFLTRFHGAVKRIWLLVDARLSADKLKRFNTKIATKLLTLEVIFCHSINMFFSVMLQLSPRPSRH